MQNVVPVEKFYEVSVNKNKKGDSGMSSFDMGKTKWVDPIRDIEDILRVESYLQNKIESGIGRTDLYARNKLLFVLGTRTGLRVNDLLVLKWGVIFDKRGKFLSNQRIVEQKTGKVRTLILTDGMKKEIEQYVSIAKPVISADCYIFTSKDKRYELYDVGMDRKIIDDVTVDINTVETEEYTTASGRKKDRKIKDSGIKHRGLKAGELEEKKAYLDRFNIKYSVREYHLSDSSVNILMKDLTEKNGIKGNYAGRSLRKTFAYRQYLNGKKHGMTDLESADNVKKILNHSTVQITFRYLGLSQQEAVAFLEDDDWTN